MDQATHMTREKILYIDDNETNLLLFYEMYKEACEVFITTSKDAALEQIKSGEYKVIFVDYLMPEISGLDFIMQAKQISPDSLYNILTAHANLEVAISAINHGSVFRFIEKPWKEFEINRAIREAVALFDLKVQNKNLIKSIRQKNAELTLLKEQLEEENLYLQEEITSTTGFEDIISKDPAFKSVLKKVEQVSGTMATVLILGETGTGKELIARAIHKLSQRSNKSFIKLNCAAIPETLIESELCGHRKGAFTGAVEHKKGKFELADHGTIFLDEVEELPLLMQPKLLRVLQEGDIEKLGGD
ncbi:MAG: sigma 54-interacting transcriptional regulator [Bacteroidales bacterium]|nr:sigma 54-interacting transcriptional regulator [Bacteroidales bacterium]